MISMSEEDRLDSDYHSPDSCQSEDVNDVELKVIKRQSPICYYVMHLAKYGDLYRLVECNDRFSESLVRNLFL